LALGAVRRDALKCVGTLRPGPNRFCEGVTWVSALSPARGAEDAGGGERMAAGFHPNQCIRSRTVTATASRP